jgi:hypothetical protein
MWYALDPPCPQSLIQFRINPHITRSHCFVCEIDDGFDSPWCPFFEGTAVDEFVQMDGVFTGDDVLEGRACLAARLYEEYKVCLR